MNIKEFIWWKEEQGDLKSKEEEGELNEEIKWMGWI
jgi:hypothetical protein